MLTKLAPVVFLCLLAGCSEAPAAAPVHSDIDAQPARPWRWEATYDLSVYGNVQVAGAPAKPLATAEPDQVMCARLVVGPSVIKSIEVRSEWSGGERLSVFHFFKDDDSEPTAVVETPGTSPLVQETILDAGNPGRMLFVGTSIPYDTQGAVGQASDIRMHVSILLEGSRAPSLDSMMNCDYMIHTPDSPLF